MSELPEINTLGINLEEHLKRTEDVLITVAMSQTDGNIRKAARLLCISESNMSRKITARRKLN